MELRSRDVLIVEDDAAIAELYSLRLRMDGYTVHHASDATTAHVIFEQMHYGVTNRLAALCLILLLLAGAGGGAVALLAKIKPLRGVG